MKAYAIGKTLHVDRISHFHFKLFHGDETVETRRNRLNDSVPLRLIRNARNVPPVFEPSAYLVVAERVKHLLESLPHVGFLTVFFDKVLDFPVYPPGKSLFEDNPDFRKLVDEVGYDDFLDGLPDVPELHCSLGTYYELLVPRLSDLSPRYGSCKEIVCRMPRASGTQEEVLTLSHDLLVDYPIAWWSYYVFNGEAFGRISAFLDRDYFEVVELEV